MCLHKMDSLNKNIAKESGFLKKKTIVMERKVQLLHDVQLSNTNKIHVF